MSSRFRFLTAVSLMAVAAGCSSGGDGGTDPGPTPAISIAVNPTSATIQQGASAAVTATLTRSGGFTGTVNLAVQGAPAGVTGVPSNVQTTGGVTTATVTILVAASTAPGTYNLTVRGSGTGVTDATTTFALTVTAAPGGGSYTLAVAPTSLSIPQGGSSTAQIALARTDFTGTVNLTVSGAPAGVTASFEPAAATGTSSILTVNVAGTAATGSATLTLRGAAEGQAERTATLNVTVTAGGGGSGNARFDFTQCQASFRPLWFASQDGDGPWTRVTGANDVYEFDVSAQRGGFAYVTQNGPLFQVFVVYYSRTELTSGIDFCPPPGTGTATGTVQGLGPTDLASIWLAGGAASASVNTPSFTINAMRSGTHDLIAWRSPILTLSGSPHRGIIRRDQNIPSGGSVGTLDFEGAESFAPATADVTLQGTNPGETLIQGMSYYTGAQCTYASLYQAQAGSAQMQSFGVPAGMQRPSDFHQIAVTGINGSTSTRTVQEWFHTLEDRTIDMPPEVPVPALTTLPAPYRRLQATFTLPGVYTFGAAFSYTDVMTARNANVFASNAWLGTQNVVLAMPDLSDVDGWDNTWAPATTGNLNWFVQATASNITSSNTCEEGRRIIASQRMGNF